MLSRFSNAAKPARSLSAAALVLVLAGPSTVAYGAIGPVESDSEAASLAPSLVRSAVSSLESPSPDIRQFGVMLLGVLADTGGRRSPLIEEALFETEALQELEDLSETGISRKERTLTLDVLSRIETRLATELADRAIGVVPADPDQPPSFFTTRPETGTVRWFSYTAQPGQEYEVFVETCDTARVALFRGKGRELITQGSAGATYPLVAPRQTAGPVYGRIAVLPRCSDDSVRVGMTSLSAAQPLAVAPRREEAPEITIGELYKVSIGEGEAHWVRFRPEAPAVHAIGTSRLQEGLDTWLDLYREKELIASDDDDGDERLASRIEWLSLESREHWAKITALQGSAGQTQFWVEKGLELDPELRLGATPPEAPLEGVEDDLQVLRFPQDSDEGWLAISGRMDRGYVVRTDARVESGAEGEAPLQVSEGTVTDRNLRLFETRWRTPADGPIRLKLTAAEAGSELAVIDILEDSFASPPPASVELAGNRQSAPEVEPTCDGFVVALEPGATGFARFAAEEGDRFFVSLGPLDEDLSFTVEVLEAESAEPLLAYRAGEDRGDKLWQAGESGEYLFRLESDASRPVRVYLTFERETPHHGFEVGDVVVLGRHREVDGSSDWNPRMEPYVGRRARIVELEGRRGTSEVYYAKVDIDDGRWHWRLRDLHPSEGN